jgi:hypothetical protein
VRAHGRLALNRPEPEAKDRPAVAAEREEPVVDEKRVDRGPRPDRTTSGTDENDRGERRER